MMYRYEPAVCTSGIVTISLRGFSPKKTIVSRRGSKSNKRQLISRAALKSADVGVSNLFPFAGEATLAHGTAFHRITSSRGIAAALSWALRFLAESSSFDKEILFDMLTIGPGDSRSRSNRDCSVAPK